MWKPRWRVPLLLSAACSQPEPSSGPARSAASALRRALSGGYSMIRNTLPFFGGGRRKPRAMASSLPRLSAGVEWVSHNSMTIALPGLRWKTCGVAASVMKIDLPSAL